MLSHCVSPHRSCRHILLALPALEPSILLLPVGEALPRYLSPVCRLQLIPCRLAGAEYHANCLPGVFLQAHAIKQADQGIKCTLEPAGV